MKGQSCSEIWAQLIAYILTMAIDQQKAAVRMHYGPLVHVLWSMALQRVEHWSIVRTYPVYRLFLQA